MTTACHWKSAFTTAALAGLVMAGCASKGTREPESGPTLDRIRATLEESAEDNRAAEEDTPEGVEDALMPGMEEQLAGAAEDGEPAESRFDLAVSNASARAFFMGLVEGTPHNMVVHPDVEGTISLELKNVTVPEVMQIVRRVYGYEYEKRPSGYIVMPARMESQIFYVDYLNVNREGVSNTRVSSGEVTSADNDDSGDNGDNGGGSGTSGREGRPGSRIKTQSKADFWGDLRMTVRSIVGSGERRSVVVDPQAGLVVVRAMPGELRDVRQYLSAAQGNLQRQVILEAKILEVRLSENNETGINWAALGDNDSQPGEAVFGGSAEVTGNASTDLFSPGAGGSTSLFDPESVAQNPSNLDFGGVFAIGARAEDFAALIRLLDTQGDVQVLSSPRVSTLNNQKAVIKVGTDEFFVTDVETDTDTGTTTTNRNVDVDLTPFFSGIALDVTPQIGRDDDITLHVHPTVSEVRDQTKTITFGGQEQTLPLALSQVRESDSIVRARDGQVIIIGGLMQDQATNDRAQPTGLGSLPLIGGAFRQERDSSERSELVILLRPVIANDGRDWSQRIEDLRKRLPDPDTRGGAAGEAGQAGSGGE